MNWSNTSHTQCSLIKHMRESILLQNDNYENLDNFSNINIDIFKDLSGVIFSANFILSNVADC